MAAAAHNPAFAQKAGIEPSVANEFVQADYGKKFDQGGYTRKSVANALRRGLNGNSR